MCIAGVTPCRYPAKCICSGVETISRPPVVVIRIPTVGSDWNTSVTVDGKNRPLPWADRTRSPTRTSSIAFTVRSAIVTGVPSTRHWSSSPTTARFRCSPASSCSSRYWAWFVSWYSSTRTWRNERGVARADLREQLEHVHRADEQVVEVHRVHAVQVALVDLEDVGDRLLEVRADELAVGLRVAQLVLRVRDLVVERRGREALGVDAELVDRPLHQPPRVGLVVDRELARVAEPRRLGAQHPRAGRVERHHPHSARGAAEEQLDPLAHLLRGLVRERDREDLVRPRAAAVDQVREAVREDARLARAGAGEDEQRALAVRDGGLLRRVEALEEGGDGVVGGRGGHARSEDRPGSGGHRQFRRAAPITRSGSHPTVPCGRSSQRRRRLPTSCKSL